MRSLTVDARGRSKFKVTHNGVNYWVVHDMKEYWYTSGGILVLHPSPALIMLIESKIKERNTRPRVVDRFKKI